MNSIKGGLSALLVFVILYLVLVVGIAINLKDNAQRSLEGVGYSNVEHLGYELWACGTTAIGINFVAVDPAGANVVITACTNDVLMDENESFWIVTR